MKTMQQQRSYVVPPAELEQGGKARIKTTGQLVELKRVSCHGISLVSFRSGGDCFISNNFLELLPVFH